MTKKPQQLLHCLWNEAGFEVEEKQYSHLRYLFPVWCLCLLSGSNLYPLSSVSSDTTHIIYYSAWRPRRHTNGFPANNTRKKQQSPSPRASFHPSLPECGHAGAHAGDDICQLSDECWFRGGRANIITSLCHSDAVWCFMYMHEWKQFCSHLLASLYWQQGFNLPTFSSKTILNDEFVFFLLLHLFLSQNLFNCPKFRYVPRFNERPSA